jgi:signal peptide peptidase SppA
MIDAFRIACSQNWLILPDALEKILAIADRNFDAEALATKVGRPLDNTRTVERRPNGVAVIPVTGPIFRYANLFTEISGATSTAVIAKDFQAALDDPSVKGIVLDINSPGGEATGINELAGLIASARGTKPINAYIGGQGASAAYWIASAADNVTADATAIIGSIGVVMEVQHDTGERDAKNGKRTYTIVSANAPNKRPDVSTEAGRALYADVVNSLEAAFIDAVAQNRGMTSARVKTDFGRGGVLVGAAAVKAGLADNLGSLESVINQTAAKAQLSHKFGVRNMATENKSINVSSTDDLRLALAAGYTADQIVVTHEDTAPLIAAARAEGVEEGKAAALVEGRTNGATAERQRIAQINALHMAGFEAERDDALADGSTPEAFAVAQAKAIKDRGITVTGIVKDSTAAAHAAPGSATPAPGSLWKAVVERVSPKKTA